MVCRLARSSAIIASTVRRKVCWSPLALALTRFTSKSDLAIGVPSRLSSATAAIDQLRIFYADSNSAQSLQHDGANAFAPFRAHHRNLDNFRGLNEPMPLYGGISAIVFFAALGLAFAFATGLRAL